MDKRFVDLPPDFECDLKFIAGRLYERHAAVLVGAGFSCNASKEYPNWEGLGNLFYSMLHPGETVPEGHFYNIMDLADEVEASFGRPALESVVQERIKDGFIQPSALHEDLLSLRWVDVFTTNYDTLLEATLPRIIGNRYSVVVNAQQLSNARPPRIVKLHGSFPAETPFILSTEDYRKYPQTHAPFVNTVRQSFLENTLCLIGFSGSDPNFLSWAGWIRDNLGKYGQKMYLITMRPPSSSMIAMLERRNIKVLALSRFNGVRPDDFAEGYKAFFDYLYMENPENRPWYDKADIFNAKGTRVDNLEDAANKWRREREAFDGRVIISYGERFDIFIELNNCQFEFGCPIIEEDYLAATKFSYEFLWRLGKTFLPLNKNMLSICVRLLLWWRRKIRINSVPLAKMMKCKVSYDNVCFIALQVMKQFRILANISAWHRVCDSLNALSHYLGEESRQELFYERALFSFCTLDIHGLECVLEEWSPSGAYPLSMSRCAMLYTALRDWHSARRILSVALVSVRKSTSYKDDKSLLQLESIIVSIYKWVLDNQRDISKRDQRLKESLSQRQDELRGQRADINDHIAHFERYFASPVLATYSTQSKEAFTLQSERRTIQYRQIDENGCSFFSFCEQAGLPFISLSPKSKLNMLLDTIHSYPLLALCYLCYYGDTNIIDDVLSRNAFVFFAADVVKATSSFCVASLTTLMSSPHDDLRSNMFTSALRLLSRLLYCDLSGNIRIQASKFLCVAGRMSGSIPLDANINELSESIVNTAYDSEFPSILDALKKIEPPNTKQNVLGNGLINPLTYIIHLSNNKDRWQKICDKFSGYRISDEEWACIIEGFCSRNSEIEKWYYATAILYFLLGVLTEEQKSEFLNKSITNQQGTLAVKHGNFYESVTLVYADTTSEDFKKWYFGKIFSNQWFVSNKTVTGIPITGGNSRYIDNLKCILDARVMIDDTIIVEIIKKIEAEWALCMKFPVQECENFDLLGCNLEHEKCARVNELNAIAAKLVRFTKKNKKLLGRIEELAIAWREKGLPSLLTEFALQKNSTQQLQIVERAASRIKSNIYSLSMDSCWTLELAGEERSSRISAMVDDIAKDFLRWAEIKDANLASSMFSTIVKGGRANDEELVAIIIDLANRWSSYLRIGEENEYSGESKCRALCHLGQMFNCVIKRCRLTNDQFGYIMQIQKQYAEAWPFSDVQRAWSFSVRV